MSSHEDVTQENTRAEKENAEGNKRSWGWVGKGKGKGTSGPFHFFLVVCFVIIHTMNR